VIIALIAKISTSSKCFGKLFRGSGFFQIGALIACGTLTGLISPVAAYSAPDIDPATEAAAPPAGSAHSSPTGVYSGDLEDHAHSARWNLMYGSDKEALRHANEAIRQYPSITDYYLLRASVFLQLEQYDKAVQDSSIVLAKRPNNCSALNYRAIALIALRKFNAALEDIDRQFSTCSVYSREHLLRASALIGARQIDAALAEVQKSIEHDPLDPCAYYVRASARSFARKYSQSLNDLEKAKTIAKSRGNENFNKELAAAFCAVKAGMSFESVLVIKCRRDTQKNPANLCPL
jgi:tetratricopeptide (TPR) repeat protein